MEEIKLKGDIVIMKPDQDSKKPELDESNLEDSIKALGSEFTITKPEVSHIGEPKK